MTSLLKWDILLRNI